MTRTMLGTVGMLALAAIGLSACQAPAAPTTGGDAATMPPATEAVGMSPTTLPAPTEAKAPSGPAGNWMLVSYGPSAAPVNVPEGVEVTANFADGTVSGTDGCNRYNASYTLDGDKLTITPGISTMMACPDPQGKVASEYMAALAAVNGYVMQDGGLMLQYGDGNVLLFTSAAASTGLAGTNWEVTNYNNGNQGVVSLVNGSTISLEFDEANVAGKVCNNYNGPYTAEGETIKIGPLITTRMMCSEEGIMEQETMYTTALQAATTWSVDGTTLTLRDASGATQVVAKKALTPIP